VTNYNIVLWKENLPQRTIPINSLSDVIVMDRRSTGSSHHYTYGFGSRGYRNYTTIGNYSSSQIGTIIFSVAGQPRLTFYGVNDPQTLRSLVMAEMAQAKK
jgi:hypothetical protein